MFASIRGTALGGVSLVVTSMVNRVATNQGILSHFQQMVRRLQLVLATMMAMVATLVMFASIRGPALRGASLGQISMVKRYTTIQGILSHFQQMVRRLRLVPPTTTAMVIAQVMFASIRGTALGGSSSGPI